MTTDNKLTITVPFINDQIELTLFSEKDQYPLVIKDDAFEHGEASIQIKEGCFYEYQITQGYSLLPSEIVSQSKINKSTGRITPNVYVGTLNLDVLNPDNQKCTEIKLEVQSVKTAYRQDYRTMLEEITEKCTDLLLQHNSPVSQNLAVNFEADANTLYQRFAFIKSIIDSEEFNDAIHKIMSGPVTKWKETEIVKDIRNIKRLNSSSIKQLASSKNRTKLGHAHPLTNILSSVPSRISVNNKTETVNTPENRFVKYALTTFQNFCDDFKTKLKDNSRLKNEAGLLVDHLEQLLSHSIFKEVSTANSIPLNSPVLQRKEGYREILRVWLMFDLAAKLIWHGGDDVYSGNKKDVAVLYEYWLFFKLLEILKEVFNVDSKSVDELIKPTNDGLGLQLKQGIHTPIEGVYDTGTRKLKIEFSYNKTFNGDNSYPDSGSWTKSMRPDYTLSIWPLGIDSQTAEKEELITHIHFDAKYKVENILGIVGSEEDFINEKEDQKKGTFKRIDLLKMHSYKDAIRRTSGSYILYPGNDDRYTRIGFHEVIPGLGAFPIRPSKSDSGIEDLKIFLHEVVQHFLNRASQREKMSLKTYQIYKDKKGNQLKEYLPEVFGVNREMIPDDTFVLVGYSTSAERDNWYDKHGKYIFRMDETAGSLELNSEVVNARYLLIRKKGKESASDFFKIISKGPKVFSNSQLKKLNYPLSAKPKDFYLVIEIERVSDAEFKNLSWDFRKLVKFRQIIESNKNPYTNVGFPFTVSLTELMNVVVK